MLGGVDPSGSSHVGDYMSVVMGSASTEMMKTLHQFSTFKMTADDGEELSPSMLEHAEARMDELREKHQTAHFPEDVAETLKHFQKNLGALGALVSKVHEEASYLQDFFKKGP